MALRHYGSGQPIDVGPLGEALAGHETAALFKATDLEVMRIVLPAGHVLRPHKAPADVTIQCIEGELEVSVDGQPRRLTAGHLLLVARQSMYGLVAVTAASALLTIALRH
ncbi:MAG: hypothetical protein QM766_04900 [Burkholderiaceae bacterium]